MYAERASETILKSSKYLMTLHFGCLL